MKNILELINYGTSELRECDTPRLDAELILSKVLKKNKFPYMVVTEMLHSMCENKTPTRAEVSDIYYAVYNGASSIMLTAETAAGKYPIEAMHYFTSIAKVALKDRGQRTEF